jgi:hypothetical protein
MPEYRCKASIEIQVVIKAKDENQALDKVDQIEFNLDLKTPKGVRLIEEWTSLEDFHPDWEVTLDE